MPGARLTRFTALAPVLAIDSRESAHAFYVEWLGFELDWEWRSAPDQPVILHVSRDGLALFLVEQPTGEAGVQLRFTVDDLQDYADELEARRPGSAKIELEPPFEIPTLGATDACGNRLRFQQRREEPSA